jgi:hypothetical protein
LRFFGFFIANGSLFASSHWNQYGIEYKPFLLKRRDVFAGMFTVFVNVWESWDARKLEQLPPPLNPQFRAGQYLMSELDRSYQPLPHFAEWELSDAGDVKWKNGVKRFFNLMVNDQLAPELLSGIDYVPELLHCGSTLEGVCAVFSNVLALDDNQMPTNEQHAHFRAAQCVKQWATHDYQPDPPFAGWEVELHMGPVCL